MVQVFTEFVATEGDPAKSEAMTKEGYVYESFS